MVSTSDSSPCDGLPPTPMTGPHIPFEDGQGFTLFAGIYPPTYPHAQKTPRDILERWNSHAEVSMGAKHIAAVHDYLARFWSHLMDVPILQITQEQVHEVHVRIKRLGWSPESFNKAVNAFSCLATYSKNVLGWFPVLPFRFHREKTEQRRPKHFLRKHQIVPFLRAVAAQDNLHALMITALATGLALRECEVLLACWSKFCLDDEGHLLFTTLGKNNKVRKIPVPEWVEIMLRKYEEIVMDPEYRPSGRRGRPRATPGAPAKRTPTGAGAAPQTDWLFPNRDGNPHSPGYTWVYTQRACKALGIVGITPQRLRASGANVLKLEGLSLDEIQKLLGHARVTTTVLYLDQTFGAAREVQNALGAKLWPGVPSAIQELRQTLAMDTRPRLLPPTKEVIAQAGKELAEIDSPAMALLPPMVPVEPLPPPPKVADPDEGIILSEKIQELRLRPRPTRPPKSLLERLVWLMPTSALAEVFCVSDVTVANWCDEDGIPKPGRGYWAKTYAATAALRKAEGQG